MKVLIADDHEIVRRGLRELLIKELGRVEVGEAGDSRSTMEQLTRGRWDLLVLDINMPGRSGLEILEEARRLCPKMPVLVLSMYPEEEFAVRAFKLGASAYINKRCAAEELIVAIRKIMTGGKYVTPALAERILADISGERPAAPHQLLSPRELQVLRMIASGKTMKEIAYELALSEKTVATYRARVAEKLGLSTNVELARYAIKHGLAEWVCTSLCVPRSRRQKASAMSTSWSDRIHAVRSPWKKAFHPVRGGMPYMASASGQGETGPSRSSIGGTASTRSRAHSGWTRSTAYA